MSRATVRAARWRATGCSVRGAAHRRRGAPNQDAVAWWPKSAAAATVVLAVADGHGSPHCPRSGDGARLAVETAVDVLRILLGETGPDALNELDRDRHDLPEFLAGLWREAVARHAELNPWGSLDADPPPGTDGAGPRPGVAGPFAAYGATLLAAAVTPAAALLFQVGDGDVLAVTDAGGVSRPVPDDSRLLAGETTSLSAAGAAGDFRSTIIPLRDNAPALILVSTDGYANSFADDAGFLQVGRDLLGILRTEGMEQVKAHLEGWLNEASEQGSGDDVTLGLLYRCTGGEAD